MNSIQLELFPREAIRVGINPREEIIIFEFEDNQFWASLCIVTPLIHIIQEGGGDRPGEMFRGYNHRTFCYQEFHCLVGTWDRLYYECKLSLPSTSAR